MVINKEEMYFLFKCLLNIEKTKLVVVVDKSEFKTIYDYICKLNVPTSNFISFSNTIRFSNGSLIRLVSDVSNLSSVPNAIFFMKQTNVYLNSNHTNKYFITEELGEK